MKNPYRYISFLFLFLFIQTSSTYAWQGKVVGVADGDTITVMHNGKGEKIRLYGIDTPEKRQGFGQRARQFTSDMVYNRTVEVDPVTTDRYGRTVGLVYIDSKCLNEELVRSGYAWVYRRYCDKPICDEWLGLEKDAKFSKIGLWLQPSPVPPWEFRQNKRGKSSGEKNQALSVQSGAFHGNIKSKVFHNSSCRHYGCKNCTAMFQSRESAIGAGYRPCKKCN